MLYRVSGKLTEDRSYSARIESDSAITAVVTARKGLNDNGVTDQEVRELVARPMQGKSSIHIGKAKSKAPAAAETPAKGKGK